MDPEAELRHMLALFVHSLLLFLTIYILMTLSDLESDYINSRDCCDKLNFWTRPRLFGLVLACFLPASGPQWLPAILVVPFAAWFGFRVHKIPQGNSGYYEPTEIRQRQLLRKSIRETVLYGIFHTIAFFTLLFLLVSRLAYGAEEVPW